MNEILTLLSNPTIASLLLTLVIALLIKSKVISELDWSKAKGMLLEGQKTVSEVTDATRLKVDDVVKVVDEISPNTSKIIQRKGRKLIWKVLRGWI